MITTTLMDVSVKGTTVTVKVQFADGGVIVKVKDFYWDLSAIDDIPMSEVHRVVNDYKSSVALKLSKIDALKARIGEVI